VSLSHAAITDLRWERATKGECEFADVALMIMN